MSRRRLPPLNSLRTFEAAARHLNFSRAADELGVTQSAVSQQVRALEEHLSLKLFRRSPRGIDLTDAGQLYLPVIREALDRIAEGTARLFETDGHEVLTISLLPTFAIRWLIPRLQSFQIAQPEIEVRVSTSVEPVDFNREDVDAAIRYGTGQWEGLEVTRLTNEDMFPVCAPSLLERQPLAEVADLAEHTLLWVDAEPRRQDWARWLETVGDPDIGSPRGLKFESSAQSLEAAAAGLGVAIGHRSFVIDDLASRRLVMPFSLAVPSDNAYFFVCPERDVGRRKIAVFRSWLLAETGRGPGREDQADTDS